MKLAGAASWVHKWLALIVGVQMLFWVASGLSFALFPIEQVRSDHRIAGAPAVPLVLTQHSPAEMAQLLPEATTRLTYESAVTGDRVAVAEFVERRPILIDLNVWRVASPLSVEAATLIA